MPSTRRLIFLVLLCAGMATTLQAQDTNATLSELHLQLEVRDDVVAISPDGSFIASASRSAPTMWISVFEAETGRELFVLQPDVDSLRSAGTIEALAFSPDGLSLACQERKTGVSIWDLTNRRITRVIDIGGGPGGLAWSADGNTIAVAGDADGLQIYDLRQQRVVQVLPGNLITSSLRGSEKRIAFSADGSAVAFSRKDAAILVYNTRTGEHGQTLTGHARAISSLAFSPSGAQLLTTAEDGTARIWDIESGRMALIAADVSPQERALSVSADGRTILFQEADGDLRLRSGASGAMLRVFDHPPVPLAHTGIAGNGSRAFSVPQHLQRTGGHIDIWDCLAGKHVNAITAHVRKTERVLFSTDNQFLVSIDDRGEIRRWDLTWRTPPERLPRASGQAVHAAEWQVSGDTLLLLDDAGLHAMSVVDGMLRDVIAEQPEPKYRRVAASADGSLYAAVSSVGIAIFNSRSGAQVRELPLPDEIADCAFDASGKQLTALTLGGVLLQWEAATGRQLAERQLWQHRPAAVDLSEDGLRACVVHASGRVEIFDLAAASQTELPELLPWIARCRFSADGAVVGLAGYDGSIQVWDVKTREKRSTHFNPSVFEKEWAFEPAAFDPGLQGADVRRLNPLDYSNFALSAGGKYLARFVHLRGIQLVDTRADTVLCTLRERDYLLGGKSVQIAFTEAPLALVTLHRLRSKGGPPMLRVHELPSGTVVSSSEIPSTYLHDMCVVSADPVHVIAGSDEGIIRVNAAQSADADLLPPSRSRLRSFAVVPGTRNILLGDDRGTLTTYDLLSGKASGQQPVADHAVTAIGLSASSGPVVLQLDSNVTFHPSISVVDVERGTQTLRTHGKMGNLSRTPFALSSEGRWVYFIQGDSLRFWEKNAVIAVDLEHPGVEHIPSLGGSGNLFSTVATSTVASLLAAACKNGDILLCDPGRDTILHTLRGHKSEVRDVTFSTNGHWLASCSEDGTICIWDAASGIELVRLLAVDSADWAVIAPDGSFDASDGAKNSIHFTVGLETIPLNSLKERRYVPRLLPRLLGLSGEPYRPRSTGTTVALYPSVDIQPFLRHGSELRLALHDRGGGIGRIQVFINGREAVADARTAPTFEKNDGTSTVMLQLAEFPQIISGVENKIAVVSWNTEGYLSSRPYKISWSAPGSLSSTPPVMWAILAGVSEYEDPTLKLRFAAKDATDMAHALRTGAQRLFGVNHVNLSLLTTGGEREPTKVNLQEAVERLRASSPTDIVVLYLAGHGVSLSDEQSSYLFLTSNARSVNPQVLSDPAVREEWGVTVGELTDWLKQIPALKVVIVIDACGAGSAAESLSALRSVTSDQLRAIERLRDRTGVHILMGCAADRVSYEASRYGQGLLTYALLEGMRGAALRDRGYVDVLPLFDYAADRVPQLARDIGGIQKPEIKTPEGATFDIGLLLEEDRTAVPLAQVKPLILRPRLLNRDIGIDNLKLEDRLRRALLDISYSEQRGDGTIDLVFVDSDQMPEALIPSGFYVVEGETLRITLHLVRDGSITASINTAIPVDDLDAAVRHLVHEIAQHALR